MSAPRGLTEEEAAAWARLAQSVTPLAGRRMPASRDEALPDVPPPAPTPPVPARRSSIKPAMRDTAPPPPAAPRTGLDSHWERKLKGGQLAPDYTLDLHGHTLDAAYDRLMHGLDQARAMDARVVLLIAGRPRPVDPADRGTKRGAIRAKLLDWLAASRHHDAIAAVRSAQRRHGGEGALYLVLKRAR